MLNVRDSLHYNLGTSLSSQKATRFISGESSFFLSTLLKYNSQDVLCDFFKLFFFFLIDSRLKVPQTFILFSLHFNSDSVWEVEVIRSLAAQKVPSIRCELQEGLHWLACLVPLLCSSESFKCRVWPTLQACGEGIFSSVGKGASLKWSWEALAFYRDNPLPLGWWSGDLDSSPVFTSQLEL